MCFKVSPSEYFSLSLPLCYPTHIITRLEETHSYVAGLLSSVFALSHLVEACTNHRFSFSVMPCFTLTHGSCSIQPLSTTTGPMPLHWDKLGLSSLLKGFSVVISDGSESMSCSFPCPDNTLGDMGMQWKQKGTGFYYRSPENHLCPMSVIDQLLEH